MAEIARLFPQDELDDIRAEALLQATRIAEALIFVSAEPVEEKDIARRMPDGVSVRDGYGSVVSAHPSRP